MSTRIVDSSQLMENTVLRRNAKRRSKQYHKQVF